MTKWYIGRESFDWFPAYAILLIVGCQVGVCNGSTLNSGVPLIQLQTLTKSSKTKTTTWLGLDRIELESCDIRCFRIDHVSISILDSLNIRSKSKCEKRNSIAW